jgi:hypothetical protein
MCRDLEPGLQISNESHVESREYRDNANIHEQPWPKSTTEEGNIHAYDGRRHHQNIKRRNRLPTHIQRELIFGISGSNGPSLFRAG